MLAGIITSIYIILFLSVPFASNHQYTAGEYQCHDYTVDLIKALNESGYEAHYALRDEPGPLKGLDCDFDGNCDGEEKTGRPRN